MRSIRPNRRFRCVLAVTTSFAVAMTIVGDVVAAVPDATRLGRAIDAYARPLVDAGHLSGQLLVTRGGKVVVERDYGWANRELEVSVTPETRFNIASITKPMTIIIATDLIESGALRLGDPIARWLPDFPRGDSITVDHLLRHRSGIPHEIVPDSAATKPRTAAEMVELAKRLPLDFPPGTNSAYSSGGYTVLARVLELASGKGYADLLEEHVFRPAGMTHSLHTDAIALVPGRAACYLTGPGGVENAPFQDLSGLVGAGSVWSTARDVRRLLEAVVAGRFGAGVRASFVRDGRLNWNGQTSGFRALAQWDSATGLAVVFAGNVVTGAPDRLRSAVVALAAGEPAPPQPALPELEPAASAERLARLTGVFRLGNGTRLHLNVRNGRLWANDWALLPMRDGGFFSPRDYGIVRAIPGSDGSVERLDWEQNGQIYPAPRVAESAP